MIETERKTSMGMDQYVYRLPRRDFERTQELKAELDRLESKYDAQFARKVEELGRKYPNWAARTSDWDFIRDAFSEEDRTEAESFLVSCYALPEYRKLQDELDKVEPLDELRYWRKAYGLHSWMSRRFGKSGGDDSCSDMVLTPEILGELVRDLESGIQSLKSGGESKFVGSYYGLEDMESDLEFFSDLSLAASVPDVVYYYYVCY